MTRIIYCVLLKCQKEGHDIQFYPGAIGKRIYENISKEAWEQWKIQQTIFINEKKLNMINVADRKLLEQKMINFLFKE